MTESDIRQIFQERGASTIATSEPTGTPIPLDLDDIVFKQMFEYAVVDFAAEVGFFSEVFGFGSIAMTADYALFTPPTGDFHFSIRLADDQHLASSFDGLKLLFMTADFDAAESHIRDNGLVPDAEVRPGSPVQRVLHFATPAGLPIEIWEDPTPKQRRGEI